jgi:hypothetical protein
MVTLNRKLKQLPSAVPSLEVMERLRLEEIERIHIGGLILEEQRLYQADQIMIHQLQWLIGLLMVVVGVLAFVFYNGSFQ